MCGGGGGGVGSGCINLVAIDRLEVVCMCVPTCSLSDLLLNIR